MKVAKCDFPIIVKMPEGKGQPLCIGATKKLYGHQKLHQGIPVYFHDYAYYCIECGKEKGFPKMKGRENENRIEKRNSGS